MFYILKCYRPSVISVTVTKGGHLRGNGLYGLDPKRGDKVWLLYKNISNRQLSKKLNYIKLRPFKIKKKVIEINYKLDLLVKIKIYLV